MLADNIRIGLDEYLEKKSCSCFPDVLKQFDEIVTNFKKIITENECEKWGFLFAKEIFKIRRNRQLDPRIINFLNDYIPIIWDSLRKPVSDKSPVPRITIDNILTIKDQLPTPKYNPQEIKKIELKDLLDKIGEYKIEESEYPNIRNIFISIKNNNLKIPLHENVFYKGGISRLLGKIYFNSAEHLIDAELPIGDYDILTKDLANGKKIMNILGEKDLSGIELFKNFEYAFASRDVSMNLIFLNSEGLFYSDEAKESFKTGKIYHLYADHGIYSKNYFVYKKHWFLYNRGFERLIKFLIDGKTDSIEMKKENLQIFMGIFALVSLTRCVEKRNAAERIEKLYYILEKIGQLDQFEYVFQKKLNSNFKNLFDFFDLLHHLYPFVSMQRSANDLFTAKWLMEKLLKWFRREFKNKYQIKIGFWDWLVLDEKETKITFDLKSFKSNRTTIQTINKWLPDYTQRCKKRNECSC